MKMIEKLLDIGNAYAAESTWKDFAAVKFCLCAMGVVIGLQIPKKYRKEATVAAVGVYLATYVPLMKKTVRIAKEVWKKGKAETAE